MEDPRLLLRRLRLGREEYCQRLLTMLVLEAPYPRWNTRSTPSPCGLEFLRALDELSFGESRLGDDAVFVDELDLPARHPRETGGAPDYAVMSDGRVWMIELKTERFSHRPEQLPTYVELARHHYPGQRIDLTYVTPPMTVPGLRSPEGVYAHVFWDDVLPLVQTTWRDAEGVAAEVREALCDALAGIRGPWKEWREETLADGLGHALALARLTQADGRQRALEHSAGSLEELKRLRIHVRDHVRGEPNPLAPDVTPWLWNQATTDGAPMTETGRTLGYELRLSRARSIAS